ncbi:hypothetical protein Pan44_16280 [Caulifigura coniformis]|uniref:Uncharacterized protein n=1 Tax=Caulifigura coniformis TaxID=2527983 RepID=A0A517SBY9_9PLAN|nr:hypothetical protein [Caulifigura coniformis]QDT53606.1 hypothetical protein Pan44_16280 [Caulifigura coniformis]
MWRMQSGDRVLTPAEWCCLAIGVDYLFDQVQADVDDETDETETGIAVFDRLTAEQKVLILAETAEALVRQNVPCPELNAVREGTVAAMFASLELMLGFEVEIDERSSVRWALQAALADDPPEEMPATSCNDGSDWQPLVEYFMDRVLWDRDFMVEEMADLDPDVAAEVDDHLRFGDGYFSAVAAEPDAAMLKAAREKLKRLIKAAPELPPGP